MNVGRAAKTAARLQERAERLGDPRVDDDIARIGRAELAPDIAPAALFLCSEGARWINGANLPVDGGAEARTVRSASPTVVPLGRESAATLVAEPLTGDTIVRLGGIR